MAYELEQRRMIDWLKDKPSIIIHAIAEELNWDFSVDVVFAIANNVCTDEATAVLLFLRSNPSNHFPVKSSEGTFSRGTYGFGLNVPVALAENWNAGKFSKGNVEFNPLTSQERPVLEELLEGERLYRHLDLLPWPRMKGIEGPFNGESVKRDLFDYFTTDLNEHFRVRAMLEDLGMYNYMNDSKYIDDFINWRVANDFGEKPGWDKR